MARRSFTEVPYQYGDGKFGVALSQTRAGVEEHIMPMAFWELDAASGLYMPPGTSTNPKKPRVTVDGEVQLSGSKTRVSSPPVTGVKTVTGVAAELFAGASRKAGRSRLVLRNMHSSLRLRIGPPTVTDSTGFGVEPQAAVEIDIDPASDVPWYAISEAGAIQVEVLEA